MRSVIVVASALLSGVALADVRHVSVSLHRVEDDDGHTAHPNAPTDLPWPNRSVARLMS